MSWNLTQKQYRRYKACEAACAGMDDPEKEIARLRADIETLRDALEKVKIRSHGWVDDRLGIYTLAREALAKVARKEGE